MGRPTGKRSRMAMGIGNESNDSSVKECHPRQWGRRKRGESLEMRSGSLGETVGTGGMPFVERADWRGGSEEKKRMMMILLYGGEGKRWDEDTERERAWEAISSIPWGFPSEGPLTFSTFSLYSLFSFCTPSSPRGTPLHLILKPRETRYTFIHRLRANSYPLQAFFNSNLFHLHSFE